MAHGVFDSLQSFKTKDMSGSFCSLPELERQGVGPISKLPVSIRIVLESVLRNCDGKRITEDHVRRLANWDPNAERTEEIPFVVARILLQDFTGVPLLVDLAAMRSAAARMDKSPKIVEPLVPVDLVIDHSVQVDFSSTRDALLLNMEMEFKRNRARYQFLKWGMQAFDGFKVMPPGIGICHQVNLEYLAKGVQEKDGIYFPDTLVGTDSHTTMINGLGVVGWGVGGIEAEAGMLGQPVYFLTPDVVGVHMTGKLKEGVTATDLVLTVTELLRNAKVVGKFVDGMTRKDECDYSTVLDLDLSTVEPSVSGPKRPQDRIRLSELKRKFIDLLQKPINENGYNKSEDEVERRYPATLGVRVDGSVHPVAGGGAQAPETIPLVKALDLSENDTSALTELEMMNNRPTPDYVADKIEEEFPESKVTLGHGDVLIAAITSCTNTSNPSVMLAAGLLAKKAVEKGLTIRQSVKTSLAPGSRVVTDYLEKTGLQDYLNELGFYLVGYGCTTCIGNSGPLDPGVEQVISERDLVGASVLSGNRNFEARVHQSVKANFLMSPPLVVAFALAGRVNINLTEEPLGKGKDGSPVYLRDIWPSAEEVRQYLQTAFDPETYRRRYSNFVEENPLWNEIPSIAGDVYEWDPESTYIQEPPYFEGFSMEHGQVSEIRGARALAVFGDSVTTDHISPAGAIKPDSPAGRYLQERDVPVSDFNSYGSRRGNDRVMTRGTFANVRIKNLMLPGTEGGVTVHQPDGEQMSIYDAAMKYQSEGVPLVVLTGQEYGTGSSRDWAAKGTLLLGVRAVIAESFERIHRSNLVGMGVLPCQFEEGVTAQSLNLDGSETFDLTGPEKGIEPRQELTMTIHRKSGESEKVSVTLRIDTPIEVEYYQHGGILPYVLRQLIAKG